MKIAMLAVVAMSLAACTPEEIAAVEAHYRAAVARAPAERLAATESEAAVIEEAEVTVDSVDIPAVIDIPAETVEPSGSALTVEVDCLTMHVVGTGFAPEDMFSVGYGAAPPRGVVVVDGGFDITIGPPGPLGSPSFGWSVIVNGEVAEIGAVDGCN